MAFSEQIISDIAGLLQKYHYIANSPDAMNNILIVENKISIIDKGVELTSKTLDLDTVERQISQSGFNSSGNIYKSKDWVYCPFEADRDDKSINKIWGYRYSSIDFPKFMGVVLFSLLYCGELPTFSDFHRIYSRAYTEVMRPSVSVTGGRYQLGKSLSFSDGYEEVNKLLYFNKLCTEDNKYVKNLPINEFTTEHLLAREHKAYPSLLRDIHKVLYFNSMQRNSYYSYLLDIGGVDLIIDDIPCYDYVKSESSDKFKKLKDTERHPNLGNVGIRIKMASFKDNVGSITLIDDKGAEDILYYVDKIKVDNFGIYIVEY